MRRRLLPLLVGVGALALAPLIGVAPARATTTATWYVDATAQGPATGSRLHPFHTLAEVQRASRPGDRIVVLPAAGPLDGGLRLKRNQVLVGAGPRVRSLASDAVAPWLTNTTAHLGGDAVRLADGATVANLRITGARRAAVYGRDTTAVRVVGNDVSGADTSCTKGFLIPAFNAPTTVPGVGIPISGGLQNGRASIMVDAPTRQGLRALIVGNAVHDATCADGIDVRLWGTATGSVTIRRNRVTRLGQGPAFQSLLAIGLQARDHARLHAEVHDNRQSVLGNASDPNLLVAGADSEGVFVNGVGPSHVDAVVTGNRYWNRPGLGGFSANGLEAVTMGHGAHLDVVVRDSHFTGSTGDVIEEGALGTDDVLRVRLDHVVAERSSGLGDTVVLPFNNGDCVLAGSLGAGGDVSITVADSVLRGCVGNGLAIGSDVANGTGPSRRVSARVTGSTITGNRGANIGIRNFTGLGELNVFVQGTNLGGSLGLPDTLAQVVAENLGHVDRATIDLGGGALGSRGGNCVATGPALSALVTGFDVAAQHDWWGTPGGPALGRALAVGSLDTAGALDSPPAYC